VIEQHRPRPPRGARAASVLRTERRLGEDDEGWRRGKREWTAAVEADDASAPARPAPSGATVR
jgi:hypothetical protein